MIHAREARTKGASKSPLVESNGSGKCSTAMFDSLVNDVTSAEGSESGTMDQLIRSSSPNPAIIAIGEKSRDHQRGHRREVPGSERRIRDYR